MIPLIGVAGFMYDPGSDPPTTVFAQWSEITGRKVVPFLFDTKHSQWSSWLKSYESSYHRAWVEAKEDGAPKLAEMIDRLVSDLGHEQVDILAHSLGTRIALEAFFLCRADGLQGAIRRVVLLNGADSVEHAYDCLVKTPPMTTLWYNLRSMEDFVLQALGSKFILAAWDADVTPAQQRKLARAERKAIQAGAHGWPCLIGRQGLDGPIHSWHDELTTSTHWSYREKRYQPLIREWLS